MARPQFLQPPYALCGSNASSTPPHASRANLLISAHPPMWRECDARDLPPVSRSHASKRRTRPSVSCASQPDRWRGALATTRFGLPRRAADVEGTLAARASVRVPQSAARLATGGLRELGPLPLASATYVPPRARRPLRASSASRQEKVPACPSSPPQPENPRNSGVVKSILPLWKQKPR
jgi:hypothetical protein